MRWCLDTEFFRKLAKWTAFLCCKYSQRSADRRSAYRQSELIYAFFVSLYLLLLNSGIHGSHDVKVKSSHRRRGFVRWPRLGVYRTFRCGSVFTALWNPPRLDGREAFNSLMPNDLYRGRTAAITSERCILYIYSTNIGTACFKHGIYSPGFPLKNAVCFIILTYLVPLLFTFYIQGVLKLKK